MSDQIYYHSYLNRDRLVHIVENDVNTCESLSVLFRLEGFQTRFSLDSESILKDLENKIPDVVILDMHDGEHSTLPLL